MKFFVKDAEGNLVEASTEQVMGSDDVLYREDGTALNEKVKDVAEPDYVKQLAGTVEELAQNFGGTLTDIQKNQDDMSKKLAAYDEAVKMGFPTPVIEPGMTDEDIAKETYHYDLAKQGQALKHKFQSEMPEETRQEMAKFFALAFRAGMAQDPAARAEFDKVYGKMNAEMKTVIGDSGNAFPIPDIVEAQILHFTREKSVVLQNATVVPMISEKHSWPVESAGPSVGWGNTTGSSDPTADAATECELTAQELSAYASAKNMTLSDARSDIVSWIAESMAEAAGQEIDNEAFNGDGYADDGVCSGIFSTAGYSVVMASTSTAFSSMTGNHLSDMIGKLDGLKKDGAKFWMHGSVIHFVRDLKDDNNRPIFVETVGAPMSGTIWGYPYKEVIKCPSSSAVSTGFVVFGNLKYFYVGQRLNSTALIVDPYGLFTTNRTRFKLYQRWGMKTALANGLVKLVTAAS